MIGQTKTAKYIAYSCVVIYLKTIDISVINSLLLIFSYINVINSVECMLIKPLKT